MPRLENGDGFPHLTADRANGDAMDLPADLEGSWSLVVFYRGHF